MFWLLVLFAAFAAALAVLAAVPTMVFAPPMMLAFAAWYSAWSCCSTPLTGTATVLRRLAGELEGCAAGCAAAGLAQLIVLEVPLRISSGILAIWPVSVFTVLTAVLALVMAANFSELRALAALAAAELTRLAAPCSAWFASVVIPETMPLADGTAGAMTGSDCGGPSTATGTIVLRRPSVTEIGMSGTSWSAAVVIPAGTIPKGRVTGVPMIGWMSGKLSTGNGDSMVVDDKLLVALAMGAEAAAASVLKASATSLAALLIAVADRTGGRAMRVRVGEPEARVELDVGVVTGAASRARGTATGVKTMLWGFPLFSASTHCGGRWRQSSSIDSTMASR
jgi:hypothetical protein